LWADVPAAPPLDDSGGAPFTVGRVRRDAPPPAHSVGSARATDSAIVCDDGPKKAPTVDLEAILAAEFVSIAIPAGLAFVAAISASAIGYRQWQKQHSFERSKGFLADRSAAYKELWSRLEAINLRLREADVRDEEFETRLRELNAFVLVSEVYFDEGIRPRVKTYLESAREASRIVQSYPEVRHQRGITEDGVIDPEGMQELFKVLTTADEARSAIMKEVRASLGAESQ
jgi:hypothetical protein